MQPPTLRSVSQAVIVRTLVCKAEDCVERKLLIELLRSSQGSCFTEDVLADIIDRFPQQLTDELLYVLAPKHMKLLKMKGCTRVTCNGLVKTITRCSQVNQIDFSGCLTLLHPTVFCCLKDFAPHITRLIFEDCEIMMDDSVQIVLMCCPQLEHLNISSCKNITDDAFNLTTSTDKHKLSPRVKQAGKHLSSVDVSGCQSLTSTAIKNLVEVCGSTLVSINIAWTGVGCIALLYLSGLSQKDICEFVQQADPSCSGLLEKTDEDESDGETNSFATASLSYFVSSNASDTQSFVSWDGESSHQEQDILLISNTNQSNCFSNHDQHNLSQCPTDVDMLVNVRGCNTKNTTPDSLQLEGVCDNQNDDLVYLANVDRDKDNNMTQQRCILHPNDELPWQQINQSFSTDEELAWQQIDQSCSNDLMWSVESAAVDSVSQAFGEGLSCLTNAFINLDKSYDDDDDDHDDSGGGGDDDGDASGSCNDDADHDDNCDHGGNTVNDNNYCIVNNLTFHNDIDDDDDDVDNRRDKDKRESGLGYLDSDRIGQSVETYSCDLNHQKACEDDNVVLNIPEETTYTSPQDVSAITHKNEDNSKEQKNQCSSDIFVDDEAKMEDGNNVVGDDIAFGNTDKYLIGMFNFDEVISDDLPSAVHGFSDALACLSTAMEDLVNTGDSSDDDGDDNNGDQIGYGVDDTEDDFDSNDVCVDDDNDDAYVYTDNKYNDDKDDGVDKNDSKVDGLCSAAMEQINLVILPQEELPLLMSDAVIHKDIEQSTSGFQSTKNIIDTSNQHHNTEPNVSTCNSEFNMTQKLQLHVDEVMEKTQYLNNEPCASSDSVLHQVTEETQHFSTELQCSPTSTLQFTLTHKPQLHSIDISNIYFHSKALGVACLKMFMTINKSLNSFAASWSELDDDALINLLKLQPDLCSLTLVDCENISDKSLQVLSAYCPKLKKIDLKGVPFITDCGVIPMLSCPLLQTLSLAEASVTDLSMFAMTEKCPDKLRDLDLSWCEDLTDKGMAAIATACTGLRTLALRQCAATFVTMEALSCCNGLTSLNIAGVDQLTDQMVITMATNLPHLTFVDVSWNSSVTSVGVGALMLNCCKLQEANFSGLKALRSKPFLPIISDLYMWRAKQEVLLRHKFKMQWGNGPAVNFIKPCPMEIAIGLGDDLPFRSTTYSPVLRSLILEYSDQVNDDHMAQIVAVCRGTLSVSDYYSQAIEPKWIFFDWTNTPLKPELSS